LTDKENTRRLNGITLWLSKGDETMNYFHQFVNHMKYRNTIWGIQAEDGSMVHYFKDIARIGEDHFGKIYEE